MAGILFYNSVTSKHPVSTPWTYTFTGNDGDDPDDTYWKERDDAGIYTPEYSEIQSNKLRLNMIDGLGSAVIGRFRMIGDFDIQLNWAVTGTGPDTQNWYCQFNAYNGGTVFMIEQNNSSMRRRIGGDSYEGTSYTSGVFRLTREGTTGTAYYNSIQQGSSGTISTEPAIVGLNNRSVDPFTPDKTFTIAEFKVNSGTTEWWEPGT